MNGDKAWLLPTIYGILADGWIIFRKLTGV